MSTRHPEWQIDLRRISRRFWLQELLKDHLNMVVCYHDSLCALDKVAISEPNPEVVRVTYFLNDGNWDRNYAIVLAEGSCLLLEEVWGASHGHHVSKGLMRAVFASSKLEEAIEEMKKDMRHSLVYQDRKEYTERVRSLMKKGLTRVKAEGALKLVGNGSSDH